MLTSASSACFPFFGRAGVILRTRRVAAGELHFVAIETENAQHFPGEFDAVLHFLFDLLRHAENVRVVLGEAAHAQQAVQHARALVAIDGAQLSQPHGQLAIAAQSRLVNQDVARAVHGLELIVGLFDFDRAEHVLAIKIRVAAGLPQIEPHDVRSKNQIVAALVSSSRSQSSICRRTMPPLGCQKIRPGPASS